MRDCYLSLGANSGDCKTVIRAAFEELNALKDTELTRISSFYETEPWGEKTQPWFVNAAAKIVTALEPEELLEAVLAIEDKFGRVRRVHWGERTLDIDILHMDGVQMDTSRLRLPHPYMLRRKFVLVPLDEIAPTAIIGNRGVRQHLLVCPDTGRVHKILGSPRDFHCSIMACVDANWGIGKDHRLLFDLPEDKEQFKKKTVGQTVVMGRFTMDTLPRRRPLQTRLNIVLSKTLPPSLPKPKEDSDFVVCPTIDDVFRLLSEHCQRKVFVIGGEQVYRALMPYVQEAYVTMVHETKEADTFLPDLSAHDFTLKSRLPAENAEYGNYEFLHYVKQ